MFDAYCSIIDFKDWFLVRHNGIKTNDGETRTGKDPSRVKENDSWDWYHKLWHYPLPRIPQHDAWKEKFHP